MGTSASIICHDGINTWATDVHYDGDLRSAGRMLNQHYTRIETIRPLVHGGQLSGLFQISGYPATDATDAEIEELAEFMAPHRFKTNELAGVSVYYHRDRKDPWEVCTYRTHQSLSEAVEYECGYSNYVYLWHEPTRRWYWVDVERHAKKVKAAVLVARQPVVGAPLSIALDNLR